MEEFRDVVGFEDYFKISNMGNLFSKRSNRILKQQKAVSGYMTISTRIGGRLGTAHCFRVHRLVADAFVENPDNKPYVNHINGIKHDNNVDNLEWATAKENAQHAIDNNLITYTSGSKNKLCKLSVDNIRYIMDSKKSVSDLVKELNVSKNTIASVRNGITYKDITGL